MNRAFSHVLATASALSIAAVPAFAQTTVAGSTNAALRVTETGAAEYRIPIRIPPGIAGVQPGLAIVFNSQGPNGLVGFGAALTGLPAIHRCPKTIVQDGYFGGVAYNANDRFCVDGRRLVAVSGTYGADGTEYRAEREDFTKIVSYGTAGNGPAWFKAWTKSGQILEFGHTTGSAIEAKGLTSIRTWALNKSSDRKGNYFDVLYTEDVDNGDFRPDRINYTGNSSTGSVPGASVRFVYEARNDVKPAYVGGALVKIAKRLTNVQTYTGETTRVLDYQLAYNYSPNSGPSRLISVKECSGDGLSCLNPITLGWQDPSGNATATANWGANPTAKSGDVSGDGLEDIVYQSGAYVYHRRSTGVGFQAAVTMAAAPIVASYGGECGCEPIYARFLVGDFDGNGRVDLLFLNGTAVLTFGAGSTFSTVSWPGIASQSIGAVGDVNGDGRADVVYASGEALYVQYSTGSGFQSPVYLGYLPVIGYQYENNEPIHPDYAIGDFDGNGRADVVLASGTAILSTSGGFSSVSWSGASWPGAWSAIATNKRTTDINGDGLADLVYPNGPYAYVLLSTGNGFEAAAAYVALDVVGYGEEPIYAPFTPGDFDGNGRADILQTTGTITLFTGKTPDQLTLVTNSLGATIGITYKPLTDPSIYLSLSSSGWPVREITPHGSMYVVSSTAASNGIGGTRTTNRFYRGARAHMTGGGFLGFWQVISADTSVGIRTQTTYRQDYPYHGLPTQVLTQQSSSAGATDSGPVISQVDNTWTTTDLTVAAGSGGKYHKVELTQSVSQNFDLNGASLPAVTTTTGYDGYGNPQSIVSSTGDGYSKTTTNTYQNNTTDWLLGRLTRSTVQSVTP
jgi:hypothetical protein